jgi:hypothetical protein
MTCLNFVIDRSLSAALDQDFYNNLPINETQRYRFIIAYLRTPPELIVD